MDNSVFPPVVCAIPYGKGNAISRQELCRKLGMSDRMVRKAIQMARLDGYLILNDQSGAGYYQSDNPDDWEKQYRQDTARALAILARRKALRRRLKALGRDV